MFDQLFSLREVARHTKSNLKFPSLLTVPLSNSLTKRIYFDFVFVSVDFALNFKNFRCMVIFLLYD